MKKSLFVFVVLAILGVAIPANAQGVRYGYIPTSPEGWYYMVQGDQVGMLTADNLAMVRQYSNQLPRSLSGDLRWNGSAAAYGLQTASGFLPMYDRNMRPMSRREATITGAAIGAAIGYGVSGNGRGTAIGAAGGAIVGLITRRDKNNKNQRDNGTVVVPPQDVRVGPDGIPVMVGNRPNRQGPVSTPPSVAGDWRVQNHTSKRAELWDGEQFIARIEPWQSIQVDAPAHGYTAVLLIPNRSGGLDQATAQIRENGNLNGWDIVAPAVQ